METFVAILSVQVIRYNLEITPDWLIQKEGKKELCPIGRKPKLKLRKSS